MEPGIYRRGEVDYGAIEAVNQSTLKAIARSPLHYQHLLEHGRTATDTMRLGSVAHTAVLEPERLERDYAVWTGEGGKTDRFAGKAYEAFCAANADRTIIKQGDLDAALRIQRAVRAHKPAQRYLARGQAELTLVWRDKRTGILCKGRLDWLSSAVADVMVDLKTARDVSQWSFEAAFAKREYDVQTAFYADGYETITGRALYGKCIAVENVEPHDVVVYDLAEVIDTGREIYREYLATLAECRASGSWPGQCPSAERVLHLPKWRDMSEDEDSDLTALDLETA